MSITLEKGGNLSLTKQAPSLTHARVGLGWSARATIGAAFDLDASAILVGENGKVRSDRDFIFYGQLADADQSVVHQGDNLTGGSGSDDEQIVVDLAKVPADIARVVITVSIYDAVNRQQNFGQVRNAYVRVMNEDNQEEITRYDLGEEVSTENTVIFAELYRYSGEWKFRAVGQGYIDGLGGVARDFGVNVA